MIINARGVPRRLYWRQHRRDKAIIKCRQMINRSVDWHIERFSGGDNRRVLRERKQADNQGVPLTRPVYGAIKSALHHAQSRFKLHQKARYVPLLGFV
jgi:hypothetical protein